MKASYKGFEAKKNSGYLTLPPVGCYVAEIQDVRFVPADGNKQDHDVIELMIEITEGEYKNRYHEVYADQDERFGNAKYKGVFRLTAPLEDDEDWRRRTFEGNLWAVEDSNDGYHWDWDEKKLKGKKVGISVRDYLYTYEGKNRSTTEIGRLESIQEISKGKVKPMKARDRRENKDDSSTSDSTDGSEFTDVSKEVSVPW